MLLSLTIDYLSSFGDRFELQIIAVVPSAVTL